jgi:hypothetical protein
MPTLKYSSETVGCGATIELESGDICLISVAQAGVLVRSYQKGLFGALFGSFFGPTLYNEKNVYLATKTAMALAKLFPEQNSSLTFKSPVLSAFANAVWNCSSAGQVAIVLNEAMARAEGTSPQPDSMAMADNKIIADLGTFMERSNKKPDHFYDANVLPHPKEAIIAAIERAIIRETLNVRVEWLRTGATLLWNYVEGVGPNSIPLSGVDIDRMPRGTSPADMAELGRILDSPDTKRNMERAEKFKAIADAESKLVDERINVAVRKRGRA